VGQFHQVEIDYDGFTIVELVVTNANALVTRGSFAVGMENKRSANPGKREVGCIDIGLAVNQNVFTAARRDRQSASCGCADADIQVRIGIDVNLGGCIDGYIDRPTGLVRGVSVKTIVSTVTSTGPPVWSGVYR